MGRRLRHRWKAVLLIDEIDKADIEFPNDLLQELDKMGFFVYETGETISAANRPIVIITSNNEKELPDAFSKKMFVSLHSSSLKRRSLKRSSACTFLKCKEKLCLEAALNQFLK